MPPSPSSSACSGRRRRRRTGPATDDVSLVACAERFARVLDQRDPGRRTGHGARRARTGSRRCRPRRRRVRSVIAASTARGSRLNAPVDVREDGRGPRVDRAVRGGDERVGRGDDLVAGADAGGDAQQMKTRGAARTAAAYGAPTVAANSSSKRSIVGPSESRPDRGPPRSAPPPARRATARERTVLVAATTPRRATSRPRRATGSSARCGPARLRRTL